MSVLVRADEIEYNDDTKQVVAKGNVYFHDFDKNEQMWCDHMEYNTEDQKGKFYVVRGETMPTEAVFMEWAPGKEKINKHTKLASKEQIKQALAESTRAIVTPDGWKLCLRDKDKNELYNLRDDPDERKNLYSDAGQGDTVKRLTDEIHQWQQGVGDTLKI